MIRKLWLAIGSIRNYERIPRLPRGMLAASYDPKKIARPEREVMARLGARDPTGIKLAMKKYRVSTVEELLALLEHQKPQRRMGERLWRLLGRMAGGADHEPHREEIRKLARQSKKPRQVEIEQRLKTTIKAFEEGD